MTINNRQEKETHNSDNYCVEIAERKDAPDAWTVEAIDSDGGIEQTIFAGPKSRERAEAYKRVQYPI